MRICQAFFFHFLHPFRRTRPLQQVGSRMRPSRPHTRPVAADSGQWRFVGLHTSPYRKPSQCIGGSKKAAGPISANSTILIGRKKNSISAKFFLPVVATTCEPDATARFGPGGLGVHSETGERLLAHAYQQKKSKKKLDKQGCAGVYFISSNGR